MPRQSPAESATEFKVGTEKTGLDGNKWKVVAIERKGQQIQRWKKLVAPKAVKPVGKPYLTLTNDGRPYLVYITERSATVYDNETTGEYGLEGKAIPKLLFKFSNLKHVFVGMDPQIWNTRLPPHYGDGNSILLYLGKHKGQNKYVFIGHVIMSFTTPKGDLIEHYWSDIGNNDSPYPVALGQKYVYFPIEYAYVPREAFSPQIVWNDAHRDFYGHSEDPWYKKTYGKSWKKGFLREGELRDRFTRGFPQLKIMHPAY